LYKYIDRYPELRSVVGGNVRDSKDWLRVNHPGWRDKQTVERAKDGQNLPSRRSRLLWLRHLKYRVKRRVDVILNAYADTGV
jgi:hypothetical protein